MRLIFAGTPQFAVPALAALQGSRHQVLGVLTQPDRPAGRGRKISASAVKEFALAQGLPVAQPVTLRTPEGLAALNLWQPDLLVVVAYGLILPVAALTIPRLGCVNIHASLLPRWRGAAPIQRALLSGDTETGVTIIQMDAGLDTGPMWLQKKINITPHMSSQELHFSLAKIGAEALLETLDLIEGLIARPIAQSEVGMTYAPKIEKNEARIDWRNSAKQIDQQVRAFQLRPIAETLYAGEQLRIHKASPFDNALLGRVVEMTPGAVLGLHHELLVIACGTGYLGISELQRSGRRLVTAREFANGVSLEGEFFI